MSEKPTYKEDEFDWIQFSADMQPEQPETFKQKIWRKTKSNPFVPIGAIGATAALTYGLYSMQSGNQKMSQLMMRARITSQAFAIAALIVGLLYANPLEKQPKSTNPTGN